MLAAIAVATIIGMVDVEYIPMAVLSPCVTPSRLRMYLSLFAMYRYAGSLYVLTMYPERDGHITRMLLNAAFRLSELKALSASTRISGNGNLEMESIFLQVTSDNNLNNPVRKNPRQTKSVNRATTKILIISY